MQERSFETARRFRLMPFVAAAALTLVIAGTVCLLVALRMRDHHARRFQRDTHEYAARFDETLRRSPARGAADAMGVSNLRLKSTVTGVLPPDPPSLVQSLIQTRDLLDASVIYGMNTAGVIVVCSPFDDGATATGIAYDFRPYFRRALEGRPARYMTLGLTTGKRGIYYSAPVRSLPDRDGHSSVIGVVVVKMPADDIDSLFAHSTDTVAVVDPSGEVFSANRQDWILRYVSTMTTMPSNAAADAAKQPSPILLDATQPYTDFEASRYAVARHPIDMDDPAGNWTLLVLRNTAGWTPPGMLALVFALATLLASLCLAASTLSRRRLQLMADNRRATQVAAETYRTIFDVTSDGIFVHEIGSLRILDANAEALRMFRCAPEDLASLPVGETAPYAAADARRWLDKAVTEGRQTFEWLAYRRDGSTFWISVDLQRCSILGHWRILAVFRDITEQKRQRESLIEARDALRVQVQQSGEQIRQLAAAVNQAAESILITDADGKIEYANPYLLASTGYTADEVMGQNVRIFMSGRHSPAFYAEIWRTLRAGKTWRGHFINRRKDGSLYEEDAAISPIFRDAEDGEIASFVAVKRDVTAERVLERQVRQSQKMAAVGQLAHKIAHDFTNILVMILGSAELARRKAGDSIDLQHLLEQIIASVNRITPLTTELMTFAHPADLRTVKVRLRRAIDGISELLRKAMPQSVKLTVEASDDVGKVEVDESQISQAILHIAINAAEAMPNGGTLTIATTRVDFSEGRDPLMAGVADASVNAVGYGVITIADTGVGMSEETMTHIFEPFFSTKKDDRNAGLGLSTVYRIVTQHKGHITVDSTPGVGSTFRIYLPLAEPPPPPSPTPDAG